MSHPYFLYAEDDLEDIEILQEMLDDKKKSNPLVSVQNGYAVIAYLQNIRQNQNYPCLIILDMGLPKLNGMDTLELLKTDDLYRLIPVVVFSSKLNEEEKEKCKQLGTRVIDKPTAYEHWKEITDCMFSYVDKEPD